MLTRDQALEKLNQMLDNKNLVKHCLAVEAAMNFYANHFNIPEPEKSEWGLAGLIHDADWEKYPNEHPNVIATWLQDQGATDKLINAVLSHGIHAEVAPESQMAYSIRAVDELTGLVTAVALVKNKNLHAVTVESIQKKWNQPTFAGGVNRADIEQATQDLGIELPEHIGNVIQAMQSIASELGLDQK